MPSDDEVLLVPPDEEEALFIARGVTTAVTPPAGLTELQQFLLPALFRAMTGHRLDVTSVEAIGPEEFARGLARRNEAFRTRIVQLQLLCSLVLAPLPREVADRVDAYARELNVEDDMVRVAQRFARGQLGLAAMDFQRNGYIADWHEERAARMGAGAALEDAWGRITTDPQLAARWRALGDLPDGTLGRRVWEFYRARGFSFPGEPDAAPERLASHDWVHVLGDYGTTVENELEVFALIARANDDLRAFSLLAMVISLFETGQLSSEARLFHYDRGHLSTAGMAERLAQAMVRGVHCKDPVTDGDSVDLLAVDWFALADLPLDEARSRFQLPPKTPEALEAGSVGPWEPGGISPFQLEAGRSAAEAEGRAYESYGASPAR